MTLNGQLFRHCGVFVLIDGDFHSVDEGDVSILNVIALSGRLSVEDLVRSTVIDSPSTGYFAHFSQIS